MNEKIPTNVKLTNQSAIQLIEGVRKELHANETPTESATQAGKGKCSLIAVGVLGFIGLTGLTATADKWLPPVMNFLNNLPK